MPTTEPAQSANVTAPAKANDYSNAKAASHPTLPADRRNKSLGLIYPGTFTFNTESPERMAITDGACRARLKGVGEWTTYEAGSAFDVPANSAFDIAVDKGIAQYICSFG